MHNYVNWKWSEAEEKKVYIGWGDINVFYNDQRRKHHDIFKISIIHFLNTLVPGTILATADTSVNKQEEPCSRAVSFLLCGTALNNTHFESILVRPKRSQNIWFASGIRRDTVGGLSAAEWSDCCDLSTVATVLWTDWIGARPAGPVKGQMPQFI